MTISITRTSRGLVLPSEETPSVILDLSHIDRMPFLGFVIQSLYFFKDGPGAGAAAVIKEALSKALVPYYPLAGRAIKSSQGELQIDCTGDIGIWFVEAYADCSLESVGYFHQAKDIPNQDLVPNQDPETEGSTCLVQFQVTHFTCGGFVIGHSCFHPLQDGLGAGLFLNAMGEYARGLSTLSVTPSWSRDFIVQNQNAGPLPNLPPPVFPDFKLINVDLDIPIDKINKLKREFHAKTGKTCSVFDVVVSLLWQNRTQAVNFEDDVQVLLVFLASTRHLVNPPLPKGFYGNCIYPLNVTASSSFLVKEANLFDVVELVQEAKARLPTDFENYVKNHESMKANGEDPFATPLAYTTLFVSDWSRVGFNDADFGWGPPYQVMPVHGPNTLPVAIVGSMPLPAKGVRLMTWSVEKPHYQSFVDLMKKVL